MKEVTMGNIKRKLLVLLLMLVIGVTPVFANMPVIDFTAIAQAITSYIQTIQEWNAQVQQWKSEYDRIAKAAKGIASGEFSEIIKSIGSLASQVSGWELGKTLSNGKDLYFDNALSSIGDGSYSLLALMSNTDLLMANYDTFMEIFEENAFKSIEEKMNAAINDDNLDGWDKSSAIMDGAESVINTIANSIGSLLTSGGAAAQSAADVWNNYSSFLNVSPERYAEVLEQMVKENIEKATGDKAHSAADILKLKGEQEQLVAQLEEKLKKLTSEDATQNNQLTAQKEAAERLIATYNDIYEWANGMESEITKIRNNQADYESRLANEQQKLIIWDTSTKSEQSIKSVKKSLAQTEKQRKQVIKAEKDAMLSFQQQGGGN